MSERPVIDLRGPGGNAFALVGIVCASLKRSGLREEAARLRENAMAAKSYQEIKMLCGVWVDYVSEDDDDE